jgi:hypothetical protein
VVGFLQSLLQDEFNLIWLDRGEELVQTIQTNTVLSMVVSFEEELLSRSNQIIDWRFSYCFVYLGISSPSSVQLLETRDFNIGKNLIRFGGRTYHFVFGVINANILVSREATRPASALNLGIQYHRKNTSS